jgi:uncharacterized protein YraI
MNTFKCSMLSAGIVALSTGWAAAAPAVVLDYLNLRFGPGYDFDIVEVIPAGWIVNAGGCADGWCQVNVNGIIGFVDANYLGVPAPAYYWSYGYAYWAYPNYASYYGYDGGPYGGPVADAYAEGRDADVAAGRRVADRARRTAVTKNSGAVPPRAAKLTGGSTTTGAATAAVRPNRPDQAPPR